MTGVLEVAEIRIRPGEEGAFVAAVEAAAAHFRAARGCRGLALARVAEDPLRFRLLVTWETIEDHMVHFRNSPGFAAWRQLAGPFFAEPPRVEHLETVLTAF